MICFRLSIVLLFSLEAICQTLPDVRSMLIRLEAPETTVEAAAQLSTISKTRPDVVLLLAQELPLMLLSSSNVSVVRHEAALAGNLRLKTATSSLVVLLGRPLYGGGLTTGTSRIQLRDDPVGRALYDIGPTVIPALAGPLEAADTYTRKRAIWILRLFNTAESRAMLQDHLAREHDETLRTFLTAIGMTQ